MTKICKRQAKATQMQICVASISICLRKVGLELDSAVKVPDCLFRISVHHVGGSSVVISIGVIRSQLDSLTVISNNLLNLIPVIGIAAIIIRFGVLWV